MPVWQGVAGQVCLSTAQWNIATQYVTDADSKRGQNRVRQVVESDRGGRDSRGAHSTST